MSNKIQISISSVLEDLKNGMTRAEIGTKYGLNGNQTNRLFTNPKLKGKKTIKFDFDVVDDAPDEPIRVFEAKKTPAALATGYSNSAGMEGSSESPEVNTAIPAAAESAPVTATQAPEEQAWDKPAPTPTKAPDEPVVEQNGLW